MFNLNWLQKKWVAGLGIVIAVLLLLAIIIPFLIPADRIKAIVIAELHKSLGRELTVGQSRLTLLTGPGIALKDITIQEDPKFGQVPFLKLDSFRIRLAFFPLFVGKIQIASLVLNHPELRLIKNQAGLWNYESLALLASPSPPAESPVSKPSSQKSLSISSLRLVDGIFEVQDYSTASPRRWRQEGVSLRFKDFSPSQGGQIEAKIDFPEKGGVLELRTSLGSIQGGNIISALASGNISCQALSLAALQPPLEYLGVAGSLGEGFLDTHLEWKGSSALSGLEISGQGKIKDWTRGLADRAKLNASFEGAFSLKGEVFQVHQLKAQFPQSSAIMRGSIQTEAKDTAYNLDLEIPKAHFDDLLRLISLSGSGAPEGISATGSMEGKLHLAGTSINPRVNGQLTFSPATIQYPGIQEKLQLANVGLQFEGNRFHSNLWEMTLGDRTHLKGLLSGNLGPAGNFSLEVDSQSPTPVADIMAMGNSFGIALPAGYQLRKGLLSLQLAVEKPFQAGKALSINGKLTLNGCETLTPFLKVPIQVESADLAFSGDSAVITRLAAQVEQTRLTGQLHLQNFQAPRFTFQLAADQLNLGQLEQWLAAKNPNPVQPSNPLENGMGGSRILWAGPATSKPSGSKDYLALLQVEEGRLSIGQVRYKTLTLTQAAAKLKMSHKIMQMDELTFLMYGGKHSGTASVDLNVKPAQFSFHSNLSEVSLDKFLADNTKLQSLITGTVSLNMNVNGSGNSYDDIIRGLTGGGKLQMLNGSIRSFDLMGQLSSLAHLQGISPEGGATKFKDLISNFTIANGRVQTSDLMAHLSQTTLRASGSFGFDKTLDYQVAAELPASLSQGQNWTAQLASISSATFFPNEQGRAVVPLRLRGALDKPSCTLDTQTIQTNLKNQLLGGGLQQGLKSLFKSKPQGPQPPPGTIQPGTAAAPPAPPEKKKSSWKDLLKGTIDELQKKKGSSSGEKK